MSRCASRERARAGGEPRQRVREHVRARAARGRPCTAPRRAAPASSRGRPTRRCTTLLDPGCPQARRQTTALDRVHLGATLVAFDWCPRARRGTAAPRASQGHRRVGEVEARRDPSDARTAAGRRRSRRSSSSARDRRRAGRGRRRPSTSDPSPPNRSDSARMLPFSAMSACPSHARSVVDSSAPAPA